jgi:hypothetical protein
MKLWHLNIYAYAEKSHIYENVHANFLNYLQIIGEARAIVGPLALIIGGARAPRAYRDRRLRLLAGHTSVFPLKIEGPTTDGLHKGTQKLCYASDLIPAVFPRRALLTPFPHV